MTMPEPLQFAEERRPTVRIFNCQAAERDLLPILWGLEEEGIPAEVMEVKDGEAQVLAKQAAHMSSLNVGIALNALEGSIVLHHRDLAGECPLFLLPMKDVHPAKLRVLGANAARLVKGDPLLFPDEKSLEIQRSSDQKNVEPHQKSVEPYQDRVIDVIVRTVLELLRKE